MSKQRMLQAGILTGLLLGTLSLEACAPNVRGVDQDSESEPTTPSQRSCAQDAQCDNAERCIDRRCVAGSESCSSDADCQNDTYCACPPDIEASSCICVPWGHKPRGQGDPQCQGAAFEPAEFKNPVLRCQWPPAGSSANYRAVVSTPLVIDLENDGQSEIVFVADSAAGSYPPELVVISGKDCAEKWTRPLNFCAGSELAAGDLDGDGKVEIVAVQSAITVFDYQGNLKASLPQSCDVPNPPAIANLDGIGLPEIISGGQVARYHATPTPHLEVVWTAAATDGLVGVVSLAEDLDGDGKLEVITGNQVYDGITGADKTKSLMRGLGSGYPAIGDFNADGHPDIVLITSRPGGQVVQVIDYFHNTFIMPPTPTPNGYGGPPTVADLDGDGRPEFTTAGSASYYVYSPDCLSTPRPAKCHGADPGVLWQSPTQDISSGSTGSSVFDFNGDKRAEVVYRDECWLRVYNGSDGRKLFAVPTTSGTALELPVVADTDGDGHADIVVSADDLQGDVCNNPVSATELGIPHGAPSYGVRVYSDPMNRWVASRSIWNQHSYHITNVNDDGSIPRSEASNFKMYNSYRQNIQGIGAGSMQPITITIIGDIFTVEERARIQGIFGAVWGFSAMVGPLLGVDDEDEGVLAAAAGERELRAGVGVEGVDQREDRVARVGLDVLEHRGLLD